MTQKEFDMIMDALMEQRRELIASKEKRDAFLAPVRHLMVPMTPERLAERAKRHPNWPEISFEPIKRN